MTEIVRLVGQRQRDFAKRLIDRADDGDVVQIGKATRTLEQNTKLHPMIDDIRRQVPGMSDYSREHVRLQFLDLLGTELIFLPKLEGQGMFPVGLRSSTLTKAQFSGLLELLYAYGAKHQVKWSEPMERAA